MLEVIGIVHASGTYNGQNYDNYNLHCVRDADSETEDGKITEIVKVKASYFEESSISIGDTIDVAYDKYGRIKAIDVI